MKRRKFQLGEQGLQRRLRPGQQDESVVGCTTGGVQHKDERPLARISVVGCTTGGVYHKDERPFARISVVGCTTGSVQHKDERLFAPQKLRCMLNQIVIRNVSSRPSEFL
eukprot:1158050-Pelagomonas_calceolata.AAC.1